MPILKFQDSIMDHFNLENNFDFGSLTNYEFPPAAGSFQNYTEVDSRATSDLFTPTDSTSPFSGMDMDMWDLSTLSTIPSVYQAIEVTPTTSWSSNFPNKTELLLTQGYSNAAASFPAQESWSASSSSSDNESEMTPKVLPAEVKGSQSSGDDHVSPVRSVRRTKKTKVEKAERLERRREKNRTSQRKFRERKEQYIQELERQCSDLQKRCDTLLYLLSDRDPDVREKEE